MQLELVLQFRLSPHQLPDPFAFFRDWVISSMTGPESSRFLFGLSVGWRLLRSGCTRSAAPLPPWRLCCGVWRGCAQGCLRGTCCHCEWTPWSWCVHCTLAWFTHLPLPNPYLCVSCMSARERRTPQCRANVCPDHAYANPLYSISAP